MKIIAYRKQIRNRVTRGRVIRAMAKSTKGGKGRISKRKSYTKGMSKSKTNLIDSLSFLS